MHSQYNGNSVTKEDNQNKKIHKMTENSFRVSLMLSVLSVVMCCALFVGSSWSWFTDSAGFGVKPPEAVKFKIELSSEGSLYGETYTQNGISASTAPDIDIIVQSVGAADTESKDNVVAPGAKNEVGLKFSLKGTADCATRLKAALTAQNVYLKEGHYAVLEKTEVSAADFAKNVYYILDGENGYVDTVDKEYDSNATYFRLKDEVTLDGTYYPVVYKADKTDGTVTADSLKTIAEDYAAKLNGGAAVSPSFSDGKYTYVINGVEQSANFDYSSLGLDNEALTWSWDIENGANEVEKNMYSGADTVLQYLQSENEDIAVVKITDSDGTVTIKAPEPASGDRENDYCLSSSFSVGITVEQKAS